MSKTVKFLKLPNSSEDYVINASLLDGTSASDFFAEIGTKANKNDIAKTVSLPISNAEQAYVRISNFGNWSGQGDSSKWYMCGFSMLITSRAGETVWLSISSDDNGKNAKAIRFMNTYSKIDSVLYCVEDNSIYVVVNPWCNTLNVHMLSNVLDLYVPTVSTVSSVPETAVTVPITAMGPEMTTTSVGDQSRSLNTYGSGTHPCYNGSEIALVSDIEALRAEACTVYVGNTEPTSAIGSEGDIYIQLSE